MSLMDDGVTEEGEMIIENGPDGKVRLTLRRVLSDDDGPAISGAEALRRAQATQFSTKPEWYLYHLLLWEKNIPSAWCFEGLVIFFPTTSFTDSDGKEYAMCLEEDYDDSIDSMSEWGITFGDLSTDFGRGIRFLEAESLDDTVDERDTGGEGGNP